MKKLIASVAVLALGFVAVGCSEPTKPGTVTKTTATVTPTGTAVVTSSSTSTAAVK